MEITGLLIANRGEIAVRIIRAASDLNLRTVAVFSEDDSASLHATMADEAQALAGRGVRAYMNMNGILEAARSTGCNAIHPGYGFLAEQADFARRCGEEGLLFIGPSIENLIIFGDKAQARQAAARAEVPILRGINRAVSLEEAKDFFSSLGPKAAMMIKAIAGGGGRGTRIVTEENQIEETYTRCRSEAGFVFKNGDLYVEEFIKQARHIEVQILGDRRGNLTHLGDRECTIQRRHQKLIEVAPAPYLPDELRRDMIGSALRLAESVGYTNLGTFEFLVNTLDLDRGQAFAFIEVNARLQVEHTVTEAVTGVDIVQTQIRLAQGALLSDLGLDDPDQTRPRGYALQARVNMETLAEDGSVHPAGGILRSYESPNGPGVRTDGFGYAGYAVNPSFDSLLAKVIAHSMSADFKDAVQRGIRALSEFRIEGVETNIPFLHRVLDHPDFKNGNIHIRWLDEHIEQFVKMDTAQPPRRWIAGTVPPPEAGVPFKPGSALKKEPLAKTKYPVGPDGTIALPAPIQGTIVQIMVGEGDAVPAGRPIVIMEAMKMEHTIKAERSGFIRRINVTEGDIVVQGHPLFFIEEAEIEEGETQAAEAIDLDYIRPDLEETYQRHAYTLDENRPEAVAKRHALGFRMPRENIAQLVDPGTFKEYGPLVVARQHQKFNEETLRRYTPADGLIAGIGLVNGKYFTDDRARTMVLSYDYTVLAGTQGGRNHYKQDRMFELAHRFHLPIIFFTEGGGGRPGDDTIGPAVAFDTHTFTRFSQLSGWVPLVGVNNGRCFAGNTALLACCDVIIATEGSTIAMGGPAMVESGGLGVYTPEELGPMSFQVPNGVVDILVREEEEAVEVAKKYLSYFQGPIQEWEVSDQRKLRHIIPENRLRLYNMREVIDTIADVGSVLEIREKFGIGIITAFIRVEGKPMGVIANNPHHLAGAIDSDGADKCARFLQLCDAFDLPVLSLMDCPGIMVGPDVEATALVRHCVRTFNAGANMTSPLFSVVVRKAYGLGVQAMCGASSFVGFFSIAWPTAEFAGMAIEGRVKLGYRKELQAIEDPEERLKEYTCRVEEFYRRAKAVNASAGYGLDDVIDPADTRSWIVMGLRSLPPVPPRTRKKYPYIDTW
ncbi:MAG: ATP-grasp domain-containing protein [Deltaproteobacteria bacterium]|nr:ATP-grasp domain-containing protein [Deltaproteobacteria bacterium]